MPNCSTPPSPTAWCAARKSRDVRVHIYGPLEARLQSVDRAGARRPQRRHLAAGDAQRSLAHRGRCARDLGLDPPERRIGLSAHDFAQALGAPEVILARAAKVAGAPTVASRFVQRIAALAGERWDEVLERGDRYLDYARALDAPGAGQARRAPGAEAAASRRGRRGCRSPPSRTGCAIPTPSTPSTFCACSRSMRSTRRRARATAAPSSTAPSAITPRLFAGKPPADPLQGTARARREAFRRRSPTIRKRARSGGRASCASRAGSRDWERERRADLAALHAEIKGELTIPGGQTRIHVVRASPTASSGARTAATPSSTTRPAQRAPRSRCAPGWRRN